MWYSLPLSEQIDADAEKAWGVAWAAACAADAPSGSGVFLQLTLKAGDSLYFSPQAHDLADIFGAKPCDKPATVNLRQVAGDRRAWELHFGEALQTAAHMAGSCFSNSDARPADTSTEPVRLAGGDELVRSRACEPRTLQT